MAVSEEGKLVRQRRDHRWSLTSTGEELTKGKHYWEVELVGRTKSQEMLNVCLGVCRSHADPRAKDHSQSTAWLIHAGDGALWGNSKYEDDEAGSFSQGDRMGMLLDLDGGSLRFFKNGVEHGPGYPAGSVTAPVTRAALMTWTGNCAVRLLSAAHKPRASKKPH